MQHNLIIEAVGLFIFAYPALMAFYWATAGMVYFTFKERHMVPPGFSKMKEEFVPMVSLMVPCYNEGDNLNESIPHLLSLKYPNYELIFINDGSTDNTGELIDLWAKKDSRIVALHQANSGKASALNHGLSIAKGKYVGCIDGDAVLEYKALDYMVQSLEANQNYGAVTGNPRVRNRSTVLGMLQVSEFSSIIGLIKRAQSLMGTIFTVSGVCCLFRKDVMEEIGGWSTNMITEDIDVSWKIQTAGLDIYYEPRALCWTLMPETMTGLFKQRLRWAQGGAETMLKYFPQIWRWRNRRLWPMYVEYIVTAIWAVLLTIASACWGASLMDYNNLKNFLNPLVIKPTLSILFLAFFMQMFFSMYIDSRYEKGVWRYALVCIWYPWWYWMLNTVTLLCGIPKAIFRNKSRLATWTSPDRGV